VPRPAATLCPTHSGAASSADSTTTPPEFCCATRPSNVFTLPMNSATKRVRGRSYIAPGVSICSIRPRFITTIRSDMLSASSWSCVT
jgi:hypothetical protein